MGQCAEDRGHAAAAILHAPGAILEGDHFVYVSGAHGSGWIDMHAIMADTKRASKLGALLAVEFTELAVEVVCGPATGGLIAAHWTAHHLGVLAVFAEHAASAPSGSKAIGGTDPALRAPFVLRRGFEGLVAGRRLLVVDDIVNTGHSVRQTVQAVRDAGGDVVGAACFCTRGSASVTDLGVERFVALTEITLPAWPAERCQLCRDGVPINARYAHGAEYLAAQTRLDAAPDTAAPRS